MTDNGQPATDTTGDDLLNDVNGNTVFDIGDVQALFQNLDDEAVQNNPELFDFTGDGTVSLLDVQFLFDAYDFTVSTADPATVEFIEVEKTRTGGVGEPATSDDGTEVAFDRALLGDAFAPAEELTVGSVGVSAAGGVDETATLTLEAENIGDEGGVVIQSMIRRRRLLSLSPPQT